MMETEPALYEVVGRQNNHLWLEVLDRKDQGIRVSVPVRDEKYNEDLQEQFLDLSVGDVGKFVLEREEETRPDWYIAEICETQNGRREILA